MMQAAEILAIPLTEPERLFQSADIIAKRFKALAMDWHPDRGGDSKVFAHINALKTAAEKKAAAGIWETPGVMELRATKGTKLVLRFKKRHRIEIGEMLVGSRTVAFLVEKPFKDLNKGAIRRIQGPWRYPTPEIEALESKYIPVVAASSETVDHYVTIMRRGENDILASDLLAHLGGKMPPRHVAWVVSSLMNICCLLEFNGIAHNGITPNTVFISPEFHSAFPLGGWWYARQIGDRVPFLPPFLSRLTPVLKDKEATGRLDREAIRLLALTLLGDASGHSLRMDPNIPKPMFNFLRLPAAKTAVEDYRAWSEKVLIASFGPRKFVDLPVKGSDVYT